MIKIHLDHFVFTVNVKNWIKLVRCKMNFPIHRLNVRIVFIYWYNWKHLFMLKRSSSIVDSNSVLFDFFQNKNDQVLWNMQNYHCSKSISTLFSISCVHSCPLSAWVVLVLLIVRIDRMLEITHSSFLLYEMIPSFSLKTLSRYPTNTVNQVKQGKWH